MIDVWIIGLVHLEKGLLNLVPGYLPSSKVQL